MGKNTPAPPPAPDPTVVAKAQSDANIATAQEQQRLNMINTYGPQGNVVYAADPNAPGGFGQTTTLSGPEQQTYDLSKAAENAALGVAGQQIARVDTALATPLSLDGLPALSGSFQAAAPVVAAQAGAANPVKYSFDKGRDLQYDFDPGQQVQGQVGGDLGQARQQAIDAVYGQATSRLDPRFQQEESHMRTQLANQGLSENSTAYQTAVQNFGRTKNDAYNQAAYSSIGAGEDAANSMFGRQLGQGQFANEAAGQMYGQNLGQAQFSNQTSGQDYGQNQGLAQFWNQAQDQDFGQSLSNAQMTNQVNLANAQMKNQTGQANAQFGNEARQQGLQERAYIQNQPIDQFNALMSSSQLGLPQGVTYSPTSVAPTDVTGAYALQSQAQQANANRAAQQQSSNLSGLMSLGSAAIMASDRRMKTDVEKIGVRSDGLSVYAYRYLWSPVRRIGVMAQEVLEVKPHAVHKMAGGWLAVDYGAL